jgi:hypothetical protein
VKPWVWVAVAVAMARRHQRPVHQFLTSSVPTVKHSGWLVVAVAVLTPWLFPLAAAADGLPVAGFGHNGVMIDASFSGGKQVKPEQVVELPGGALVVAGLLQATGQPTAQQFVARYLPSGQLDPAFGSGGVIFPKGALRDVAPLPDGRLVVTATSPTGGLGLVGADGSMTSIAAPVVAGQLVRRPDGAVFALESARQSTRLAVLVLPNGSIDATFDANIVALMPSGSSMGANNIAYSSPNSTQLFDGRLVVAFAFSGPTPGSVFCGVVALNGDGHYDTTFGVNGLITVPRPICRVDHFTDDTIRITGDVGDPVLTFSPDGHPTGTLTVPFGAVDLAFAGNGLIYKQSSPNEIVALDKLGNVDTTFGVNGFATLPGMTISGFELLDSGNIVTWGNPTGNPAALAIGLIDGTVGTALQAPMAETTKFVPVSPRRILDTRDGLGAPAGAIGVGGQIDLRIAGVGGLPDSGVAAVVLNITATEAARAGYVSVYPSGTRRPTVSSLNLEAGQTAANLVTVKVGANGKVTLFTSGGTHLVADVAGYYTAAVTASDGRLQTSTPERILDTRIGLGAAHALTAGAHIDLQVAGRGPVPATGAAAVVLNITGDQASRDGFITAWPTGVDRPVVSNLNLVAGETRANLVVVPIGADGQISLFSSGGTELIADVAGWFTGATAPEGSVGLFVPISPTRMLDTRQEPTAPTAPVSSVTRQIGSTTVVPPEAAAAVSANVTVTESGGPGFITAWPADTQRPLVSNLNTTRAGQTVPNAVVVPLGHDDLALYTQSGAHVIIDVNGWYTKS